MNDGTVPAPDGSGRQVKVITADDVIAYLKAHPDSMIATLRFGIAAQAAGRLEVARTYLQRVIDKAPDSPEAVEARKYLVMWE